MWTRWDVAACAGAAPPASAPAAISGAREAARRREDGRMGSFSSDPPAPRLQAGLGRTMERE